MCIPHIVLYVCILSSLMNNSFHLTEHSDLRPDFIAHALINLIKYLHNKNS